MGSVAHRQSRYLNNRAENSHQPTRQRERESGRLPMHRANIASAEALIDEVTLRLHAPHPVSARGMARLRQLPSHGTSPLYRYGRGDLAGRLGAALAAL